MRTTLSIDDELLEQAKKTARRRGQTLGQYVESAVRRDLVTPDPKAVAIELPTFTRGTGMRPGIDPSSNRALYDALDASGDLS
ncbi:MAG: CopG family transcriptional regulator [Cryobacterium sp.]|nr:CopG family transcriptional regulator [Cryobacterium sp.]MBX3089284.1 CopG family transcriptional regulator [Cryobacterium sp.]MBX3116648.1 CopG family transcriptional regulator [Cryobacterium sp.]MCO5294548.1 CopG family transcriptional regulator [Homoserinimonas sp.]MCW5944596.1 CopG family transcriptional regulator [Cryobacterium sp.]